MDEPQFPPATRRGTRRGGMSLTLAQVAREAGVSPMTVSRVINRDERVADATRERVETVIRDLGYVPNPAARSLASGKQCRIGLLYANPSAAYLSEFLIGALAECGERDAQLIVEQCAAEENSQALVRKLTQHRVDAVLLPPPLCDDPELVDALLKARIHVAQVATGQPAPDANAVMMDDEAAAMAMTEMLIGLGHRRIGYIGGHRQQTASALRLRGYFQALQRAGIDAEPALVVEGDYSYRSGLRAAGKLLDLPEPPTAIFAANDDMAAAAVAIAHRRNLNVPENLSICGFDDTAIATTIWPELTTIHQPVAEMARNATRLLADAVAQSGRAPARHERVGFSLIPRASHGLPGHH